MAKKAKAATPFHDLITEAPKNPVLSDNPVHLSEMDSDLFNFSYQLGPIYDIIRHKDTQMPLTIGIYGKWGSGKTTAMRWLDEALQEWGDAKESKNKVTTRNVWFYPWKYHDREDIWRGLISEVIINAIDVKQASVKTVMSAARQFGMFMGNSFLHVLDNIEFTANAKVGKEEIGLEAGAEAKLSLGMVRKVIEEYQQQAHPEKPFLNDFEDSLRSWLNGALKNRNERMVIFIDDLDRCMPDIALQVLEALKLYLRIDNLIFVIGMDRSVVQKAVKAYYIEKNIEDIDAEFYLNKMFQVEVSLAPSKTEIDTYLDKNLALVKYKNSIEEPVAKKKTAIFELFKDLIAKYGRRNPREVKRLINSSLIRGVGAERIPECESSEKPTFEQGVQLFFIQKILAEKYGRPELVGDDDIGDGFFGEWSKIVRDNQGTKDFPRTIHLPDDYHQQLHKARADKSEGSLEYVSQSMQKKDSLEKPDGVPSQYHDLIKNPQYKELTTTLLKDIDLGDLMQIEYSASIATFVKDQQSTIKTDDNEIILNAIAAQLETERQQLTFKDVESLTKLNLLGKKISSIAILKHCRNLKELNLNRTGFKDLSSLKDLAGLKTLYLSGNQVNDISSLKDFVGLNTLHLSSNQISDITPLRNLTGLNTLSLSSNQINDISPLKELAGLKNLYLSNNQISDIFPLKELTGLDTLWLYNNQISNVSPLKSLANLTDLWLDNNQISDISPLKELSNLTELLLDDNQISDISPLKELTTLEQLQLSRNQISDISPLKSLANLSDLSLDGNQLTDDQINDLQRVLPDLSIESEEDEEEEEEAEEDEYEE